MKQLIDVLLGWALALLAVIRIILKGLPMRKHSSLIGISLNHEKVLLHSVMLSGIILSVHLLGFIVRSVIMLGVSILSVIMLNVTAPQK